MAINVTLNGVVYSVPGPGDVGWGSTLDTFFQGIAAGTLQPIGGSQPLSADLDLGASFGPLAAYYKSKGTNVAQSGVVRLGYAEAVAWRNQTNVGDLVLGLGAQNQIQVNGSDISGHPHAIYTQATGNTIGAGPTIFNFSTLELDTDAAVTTGASWKFTVPGGKAGTYAIGATITLVGAVTGVVLFQLYKNGSAARTLFRQTNTLANTSYSGSTIIKLATSDFLDIRTSNAGTSTTNTTNALDNSIYITRIGD